MILLMMLIMCLAAFWRCSGDVLAVSGDAFDEVLDAVLMAPVVSFQRRRRLFPASETPFSAPEIAFPASEIALSSVRNALFSVRDAVFNARNAVFTVKTAF